MSGHDFRALVLSLHLKAWRWLHPARFGWVPYDLWWRLAPSIPLVVHTNASLDQSGFQFYNDDGSESTATSVAAEDTNATLDVDTVYHLRIQVDDTASGAENNVSFQLQRNLNGAGWVNVDGTSSVVQSAASQLTENADTTARLTAPTGGSFISPNEGQDEVDGTGANVSFADNVHDYVEVVYSFQILSADVANNDTIQFRVIRSGGALDSFSITPQATVNEAPAGTLDQANFRGRTVDANNAAANAAFDASDPALNTDFTADSDTIIRLRFEVEETGVGSVTDGFKLQYRVDQAGGTSFGAWTDVGFWEQVQANRDVADDAPLIGGTQLAAVAEGAATTDLISGSAASFVAGEVREASPTGSITLASEHTELDFAVWIAKLYAISTDAEGGHNADGSTWQFRVVRDDGTALNSYTNTPTVTLNHQPTHIGGQHVEGPGRIGPFEDSNGNLYALVEAADVATFPEMMKKPSGGHWAPVDHVNQPNIGDLEAVDIRQVGDTLHIAHNPGDEVHYYTFHMSSHGTNPDTWQLNETVETGYTGSLEQATAIEVDSQNGTVIIFYDNNGDIVYKRRVSGTWDTSNTTLDTGTLNQVVTTKKIQGGGATDQAIVFYEDYTNLDIYVRTINVQSGTASTRTLVEGDPGDEGTGQEQPVMGAVYYDDSGTDRVMVAYREETSDNMETRIINDPWGTLSVDSPQVVSDAAIHQNAKDSRQNPGTLVLVGSTFYAFWSDLSTKNLLYSTMDVGGASWAAPTTLVTGAVHWIDAELNQAGSDIEIVYLDYNIADFAETNEFGIGNGHIESTTLSVSTGTAYSETLSTSITASTTAADSLNAADAVSTTATATTTSADAKAVTETLSTTATATTTVVDSRLSNEAVSTAITSTTTLTDSLSSTLSESLSTTITSTVSTADAHAVSDSLATTVTATTTTADSLASSEAVSTSITSTTAITDTLARAYSEALSTTATATTTVAESATYAVQSRGSVLEAIGLETWWAFDDPSFPADKANSDVSGNPLTLNNSPAFTEYDGPIPGKDDYSSFDGVDQYGATVNDSSMLLSTYSIEAWFRIDSAVSGDGNIISASGGTGAFTAAYALWYDFSAGTLKLTVTDLTRIVFTPNLDQWYHVVVTVEDVGGGVSERRVYIDTVEEDAYNFDNTLDASDGVVEVGRYAPGSSNYWHGDISEIAYFDVVLTPEDVERLFVTEYWSETLSTSGAATTTLTDTQAGSFTESLTTTITSTTAAADSHTAAEAVSTAITATTSSQDALGASDGLSTAITLSSEASDVAAMAESVASALSATTTLSDTLTGVILEELATSISSTTTATDTAGFVDTASVTVTATTVLDDTHTPSGVTAYEEALATSITSTTSTADLAALTDSLAVTMVMTTAMADRRNKQLYTSGISKATGASRATDTAGGGTNGPSDAVGGQKGSRVRAP